MIWGSNVDQISDEIENLVLNGLDQSTQQFLENEEKDNLLSKQDLENFYSKITAEATNNLALMKEYIRRNVFDLPDGFDITSAASLLDQQIDTSLLDEEKQLDESLKRVRNSLIKCDHLEKEYNNIEQSLQQRKTFVQQLHNKSDPNLHTQLNDDMNNIVQHIQAAEDDFNNTTHFIHQVQANDPLFETVDKVIRKPKESTLKDVTQSVGVYEQTLNNAEEHEPIQHFMPSAKSILQITMQGDEQKLKDLASLRSRLLG